MGALISVIMPAYNAEKWIEEAIESILEQTYSNWELIIINDGSVDNTVKVCERYAQSDKRIRIFTQNNQGPSAARNYGLSMIKGDYFTIIDCDDTLRHDSLQLYLEAAEKYDADTVIAGYRMINAQSGRERVFLSDKEMTFTINENINIEQVERLLQLGLMASNWNKLYRKRLAKLSFDEKLSLNEDVLFSLTALSNSEIVAVIPHPLYEYKIQNSLSVSSRFHPEFPDALKALDEQLLRNQPNDLRYGIKTWLMNYMYIYICDVCTNPNIESGRVKYLKKVVNSYVFKKYGKIKNADTKKRKVTIILLKLHCFNLYIKLMQLKKRNPLW